MFRSLCFSLKLMFYRFAAKGWIPATWFESRVPAPSERAAREGRLTVEIVSHCWQYSHFLAYQLSSLVNAPPSDTDVIMTVFHCPEDEGTAELLEYFSQYDIPGVTWNWWPLRRQELFRRSIGRNRAALASHADWVWFTDCDVMFLEGCLDSLSKAVQGSQEALVFPSEERVTELLPEDNPMLKPGSGVQLMDIDTSAFTPRYPSRATGPLQITHGDICREVGYCSSIPLYQEPVEAFAKCHEDRAFRWLLGSQGIPVAVRGLYRIRHIEKGRYTGSDINTRIRTWLRTIQDRFF